MAPTSPPGLAALGTTEPIPPSSPATTTAPSRSNANAGAAGRASVVPPQRGPSRQNKPLVPQPLPLPLALVLLMLALSVSPPCAAAWGFSSLSSLVQSVKNLVTTTLVNSQAAAVQSQPVTTPAQQDTARTIAQGVAAGIQASMQQGQPQAKAATSGPRRVVVMSDIHMGDNSPTCWYQQSVHEGPLLAMLQWVLDQPDVAELVLAGDVFDTWTYPFSRKPPSVPDIIAANPNVFKKLGQVLDALRGNVTYMVGNHDIMTTPDDIAGIVSPQGRKIRFVAQGYKPQGDPRLVVSHGHQWTMFNAFDLGSSSPWKGLPMGHFITRSVATYWAKPGMLKQGETVAGQAGQGAPNGMDWSGIARDAVAKVGVSVTTALINGVYGKLGLSETEVVQMWDGSTTTLAKVKQMYGDLFSRWQSNYGGGADGLAVASKAALADYDGSFMGWFAQREAFSSGASVVVYGHTHAPISGLDQSLVEYVNTGFACPATPDMPKLKISMAVVTLPVSAAAKPQTANYFVTAGSGSSYTISTFVPPSVSITASPGKDYSCYVAIDNRQEKATALTLAQMWVDDGHFVNLPQSIPPGALGYIWMQDYPGLAGSGGAVRFTDGANRDVVFNFGCPLAHDNTASGGTDLVAAAGNPDGAWSATAPGSGYPLFVKFTVDPSLAQGMFKSDKGRSQNSFATSGAGLQPFGAVKMDGSEDLCGVIQGKSDACITKIRLERNLGVVSSLYFYTLTINGKGPSGWNSGSLYVCFQDEAGKRQQQELFWSTPMTYTVSYNSVAPAIVRIEWSNSKCN